MGTKRSIGKKERVSVDNFSMETYTQCGPSKPAASKKN